MSFLRSKTEIRPGRGIDWATLPVAAAIYAGWFATTTWHASIPTPLLFLVGGWLVAWHGSLQHETIHGHPTGIRPLDGAIGFVPLSLWLPYRLYRSSHLAHHASPAITDPHADPESRYVDRRGGVAWLAAKLQSTLPGHLVFGPPIAIARFAVQESRRFRSVPLQLLRDWLPHLVGVGLLLLWLNHVGLGVSRYILLFVYPGMALNNLRSYAEHRADVATSGRAATVERGGLLALLFLNNNLHAAHHERPGLAWYRLPPYHRAHRARLIGDGAILYSGYGEVIRRFLRTAHDTVTHPHHRNKRA